MVDRADLGLLTDVSINTVLINILELLENRLRALDTEATLLSSSAYDFKNALSTAIRAASDQISSKEVTRAIQQLNLFYLKYGAFVGQGIIKQLEARNITVLKNALVEACIKTMSSMDQLSLGLLREAMEKKGFIKGNFAIDTSAYDKLREKLRRRKKNGQN